MTEHDNAVVDPFAHLHEEDFEQAFNTPELGVDGMIAMGGRTVVDLGGNWNFVLDPFCEGLRQRWFEYDATPIDEWIVPRDHDGGDWQQMTVPGCWNMARPEWFHYEGSVWYERRLDIPPAAAGERLFLRIGAATGRARLFLNGAFLGIHHGSSTPFFVEVTDRMLAGGNRLMVQVDNSRRADAVPMDHFDWFNYGGIHREVSLLRLPALFIRDFRMALLPEGDAVGIDVRLSTSAAAVCRVEVEGLGMCEVEVRDGRGHAKWPCHPRPWSPDDPFLYPVSVTCEDDRLQETIGFRTISVSGRKILLNGQPVQFRGICVHEDDRELGRCTGEADIRRRFRHVLELGGNAARLAHYPHHELAARIADEMGILLWEEIPVYWAIDFANPATLEDARNQLRELIARDFNRASVVFWGVGNENADTDARLAFMSALAATAKTEDPSRLTVAACLINREHFRIEDRLTKRLDVIGLNEYFGWYEPGYENLERLLANSSPDRPVVISETGADALAGFHGSTSVLFTEERQAEVLAAQARLAGECSYVAGLFPWLLYDFRSLRRQTTRQRGWNRKGIIAEDKTTRKMGFQALRMAYGGDAGEANATVLP
ncbi:MAG: hypothetical protein KDG54_14865 [Geminicoccaceae bacterium]|nr:hypothetical protein [Geminicoccaceae bacterium]